MSTISTGKVIALIEALGGSSGGDQPQSKGFWDASVSPNVYQIMKQPL